MLWVGSLPAVGVAGAAPALAPHAARAAVRAQHVWRHGAVLARSDAGPSPEEWREFRAKLISGGGLSGLKTTAEDDGGKEVDVGSADAAPAQPVGPVAQKNLELLQTQNPDLWNEYMRGAWAHESPVEVGGLLVRLTLSAQLTYEMRNKPTTSHWGGRLLQRIQNDIPITEGEERSRLLTQWKANHMYCYRMAESLVQDVIRNVAGRASNGRIDIGALSEDEQELVAMYAAEQQDWQQVCLVTSVSNADNTCLAINRPLATKITKSLAEAVLNGQGGGSSSGPMYNEEVIDKFIQAFGSKIALYLGGPKGQSEPAVLVHGFDLEGATEIAAGTRIFTGGVKSAIEGVLSGTYSPLDFRWFIGRHENLDSNRGEWRALACARPIALKQCLGLPKPLWHEVLELCGGELAELSRIEILKRSDLEQS